MNRWAMVLGLMFAVGCKENSNIVGDGGSASSDAALAVIAQRAYVKASNTGAGDGFGFSVALSADGSTLVVGAAGEDSAAIGIGGTQADNSKMDAGAVYVFTRAGTTWNQQAYVKPSNGSAGDLFGSSVALSADGSTLVASAFRENSSTGAVYVFDRAGTTWNQQAYLHASNSGAFDFFGRSVALSADGAILAVGAEGEDSGATGIGGNQADETATNSGAVYMFARAGAVWSQQAYVKASNTDMQDSFGVNVALSADGATLAVNANREDGNATGIDGNQSDNSALEAGAVYVFTRAGTAWTQQAYVKASNTGAGDYFGHELSLSADGSTLAIGALLEASGATGIGGNQTDNTAARAGAVYMFTRVGTTWTQQAYVKASNTDPGDTFGGKLTLSADGSTLAVSAESEASAATGIDGDQADDTVMNAGAVYMFTRVGTTWSQRSYIKASNGGAGLFGASVGLSADGSTLVVGAPNESSGAIGIDGNESDKSALGAGAVYAFQ